MAINDAKYPLLVQKNTNSSCVWYKQHLYRLLSVVFPCLFCLLLISCQQHRQQSLAESSLPRTSGLGGEPERYEWAAIINQNGKITSVGTQKLPISVQLPSDLTPIGHVALISHYSYAGKVGFDFFFLPQEEKSIRRWISGFPKGFPLPKSSYGSRPIKIHTYNHPHTWSTWMSTKGSFGAANLQFIPWDRILTAEEVSGDDDFSKSGQEFRQALTAINSPIPQQGRFIEMQLVFFPVASSSRK